MAITILFGLTIMSLEWIMIQWIAILVYFSIQWLILYWFGLRPIEASLWIASISCFILTFSNIIDQLFFLLITTRSSLWFDSFYFDLPIYFSKVLYGLIMIGLIKRCTKIHPWHLKQKRVFALVGVNLLAVRLLLQINTLILSPSNFVNFRFVYWLFVLVCLLFVMIVLIGMYVRVQLSIRIKQQDQYLETFNRNQADRAMDVSRFYLTLRHDVLHVLQWFDQNDIHDATIDRLKAHVEAHHVWISRCKPLEMALNYSFGSIDEKHIDIIQHGIPEFPGDEDQLFNVFTLIFQTMHLLAAPNANYMITANHYSNMQTLFTSVTIDTELDTTLIISELQRSAVIKRYCRSYLASFKVFWSDHVTIEFYLEVIKP